MTCTVEEVGALVQARADGARAVVAEADRPARKCPVCGTGMRIHEYANSGVAIDECGEHGTWLDSGELERIEAFAEGMRRGSVPGARLPGMPVAGLAVPPELLAGISATLPPRQS